MLIDYHAHVNFSAFKNDADEVIKRALDGGVFMILVGTQIDTSRRAVEMAEKYEKGVYAAIALHPIHLGDMEVDEEEINPAPFGGDSVTAERCGINFKTRAEIFDPNKYRALAQSKKVVAIGECGLDYFHSATATTPSVERELRTSLLRTTLSVERENTQCCASENTQCCSDNGSREKQQDVFCQHLDLAEELKLPVILHCRGSKENPEDAYNDLLKILKERKLKYGGAIHCFMSTLDIAQEFIKLGFYIGFTGVITFPRPKSALNGLSVGQAKTAYAEIVREVPLDKILVETDAPYLAPAPFRGKRNEPRYVRYVAEEIAEIKNMNKEEVEKQLFENTLRLFNKIEI